jgi:hypothetical protein
MRTAKALAKRMVSMLKSKKNSDKNESNDGPIPESMFGLPIMLSNLFTEGHVATGPGVVDWRTA